MKTEFAGLRDITRRHFFSRCGLGLGSIALASLLNERKLLGASISSLPNPMAPKQPQFAPRAKNIMSSSALIARKFSKARPTRMNSPFGKH